jgi:hypothetical protein
MNGFVIFRSRPNMYGGASQGYEPAQRLEPTIFISGNLGLARNGDTCSADILCLSLSCAYSWPFVVGFVADNFDIHRIGAVFYSCFQERNSIPMIWCHLTSQLNRFVEQTLILSLNWGLSERSTFPQNSRFVRMLIVTILNSHHALSQPPMDPLICTDSRRHGVFCLFCVESLHYWEEIADRWELSCTKPAAWLFLYGVCRFTYRFLFKILKICVVFYFLSFSVHFGCLYFHIMMGNKPIQSVQGVSAETAPPFSRPYSVCSYHSPALRWSSTDLW